MTAVSVAANKRLGERVARAAEDALVQQKSVSPIDVLIGLGWLHPVHLDPWRQRRVADLEQLVQVGPEKVALAIELLHQWATAHGLPTRGTVPGAGPCRIAGLRDRSHAAAPKAARCRRSAALDRRRAG